MTHVFVDLEQGTEEWLRFRRSGPASNPYPCAVGGSDCPIIMGVSPYKDIDTLWAEKSGIREPAPMNFVMLRGHQHEDAIRSAYVSVTGTSMRPAVLYNEDFPWRVASLDGIDESNTIGLECKWCKVEHFEACRMGLIPDLWWPQLQSNMEVAGIEVIHLWPCNADRFLPAPLAVFPDYHYQQELQDRIGMFCECVKTGTRPSSMRNNERRIHQMPDEFQNTRTSVVGSPHSPSQEELDEIAVGLEDGETVLVDGEIDLDISLDEPKPHDAGDVIAPASPELVPYGQPMLLLAGWVEQRDEWIANANAIQVSTPETDAIASAALAEGTSTRTAIEKALKKHLEAPKAAIKRVQEFVSGLLEPLERAETRLKEQLGDYRLKMRDARLRAEEAAAKALASARQEAAQTGVELPQSKIVSVPTKSPGGDGTRTTFRLAYRIVSPDAVPRHLCSPDPALIQANVIDLLALNAFTSTPQTLPDHPYIEVWIDSSVSATGRKKRS